MSGESLDHWSARLQRQLPELAARPAADLARRYGPRVLAAIRAASPRTSGALAASWRLGTAADGSEAVVSSDDPAAAVLEHGATLRGRPYLAVPIALDARRIGGPRQDSARLFVLRARDGRLFLASHRGSGIEIRWRLMSTVTMRPRPFAGRAFRAAGERTREDLGRTLREVVDVRG